MTKRARSIGRTSTASLGILMAVPSYPPPVVGGLEKQAHELARELVARGHHVASFSGRNHKDQPASETVDGVQIHRIGSIATGWLRWFAKPWKTLKVIVHLVRHADVVHVHVTSGFGMLFIILTRLLRVPVLVKLANVGASGIPGLRARSFGTLFVRILARADAVVAMAPQSLSELEAIAFPNVRVLATPNGIRLPPRPSTRAPISERCRIVLVGRLSEEKGIFDLLTALQRLQHDESRTHWSVDIIGDGPLHAAIDAAIVNMGLQDKVRLVGHRADVQAELAACDIFVLPSYREGNSNAILEAMCAGLPVISTTVGGTPMMVGPQGRNLLHAPGDVQGLADRIALLINEPHQRLEFGAAMRRRVEDHFDIRVVARTYENAYRLLAQQQRTEVFKASNAIIMSEG
jgi:glycosyltransferase involved in cell wall biosynthesis